MIRFTIRDLLWLVIVVAMAVACWTQPSRTMGSSDNRIEAFRVLAGLFVVSGALFVASRITE
jgi:hypothetical protein